MRVKQKDHGNDRMGYSVGEAAGVLGLGQSGLWKWIALGKVRSVKIGNRRIISAHEIERLLTEGLA